MATVVILAGGKSRRMGQDKLELALDGSTMLKSTVKRFAEEFEDLFLSVADAKKYPDIAVRRIVDILPGAGPLSGLHAALKNTTDSGVFLVAADLPYACPRAAKRIIGLCAEKEACVIRLPDGRIEPLFGYYRKTLFSRCQEAIEAGEYRMSEIILSADTRYIKPEELGELWDKKMLLNINYPEDYAKISGE